MKNNGLEIDFEIADKITLINLTDYRKCLQGELDEYYKSDSYLHPDDVVGNKIRIEALNLLIKDFGGE